MIKKILLSLIGILVFLFLVSLVGFLIAKPQEEVFKPTPEQIEQVKVIKEEKGFDPTSLKWDEVKTNGEIWSGRDAFFAATLKNELWLSGGVVGGTVTPPPIYENIVHASDLWSSADLSTWRLVNDKAPWGERRAMAAVEFKDKLWLIGGWDKKYGDTKGDVWSSKNGSDWTLVTASPDFPAREGHTLVVFKDKLWVSGGVDFFNHQKRFNDVWYSEDGKKWTLATDNAPWAARYDQTMIAYKDKLWMIGGMTNGYKTYKDVWSSEDGANWTLVTDTPPWPDRHGHISMEYKGLMWIIGGWCETEQKGLNDTWFSEDGLNWQRVAVDAEWAGREDVSGVIMNDKMVILGGMEDLGKQWKWGNDIWQANFAQ